MTTRITLEEFADVVTGIPELTEDAALRALRSAAMRAVAVVIACIDSASPHPAVNNGQLRQSVRWERLVDGALVVVDAPHAIFMEEGTRAHFPPLEPLIAWVIRKGFADSESEARNVAYTIARKIARNGIAPRRFFEKAMDIVRREIVPEEIRDELRQAS